MLGVLMRILRRYLVHPEYNSMVMATTTSNDVSEPDLRETVIASQVVIRRFLEDLNSGCWAFISDSLWCSFLEVEKMTGKKSCSSGRENNSRPKETMTKSS